jgi:hypothetical protein
MKSLLALIAMLISLFGCAVITETNTLHPAENSNAIVSDTVKDSLRQKINERIRFHN